MSTYDNPIYKTITLPAVDLSAVQNRTVNVPTGFNKRIEEVMVIPTTDTDDSSNTTLLFGCSGDTDAYGTLLVANTTTSETQVSTAFGQANGYSDMTPTDDLFFSIAAATGNGDTGVADIAITLAMWKSART